MNVGDNFISIGKKAWICNVCHKPFYIDKTKKCKDHPHAPRFLGSMEGTYFVSASDRKRVEKFVESLMSAQEEK